VLEARTSKETLQLIEARKVNLTKRTVTALVAAALLVLALPGLASAANLETPSHTLVPVGKNILGTSTNFVVRGIGTPTITCPTVSLAPAVTENTGTVFNAVGYGTTTGQCESATSGAKEKYRFTELKLTEMKSLAPQSGVGRVSVGLEIAVERQGTGVEWVDKVSAGIATYALGGSSVTLSNLPFKSAVGNGTISATFSFNMNMGKEVVVLN
jgi:hypothetical protein